MADRVGGHLVPHVEVLVDQAVVGGGLGDEVSGSDVTSVGVLVVPVEQLTVVILLGKSGEPVIEGEVNNLCVKFLSSLQSVDKKYTDSTTSISMN